jgi:hypothetical protein
MDCQNCNSQNPEDAVFCQNCGFALKSTYMQKSTSEQGSEILEPEKSTTSVLITQVMEKPENVITTMPNVYGTFPPTTIEFVPVKRKLKKWQLIGLVSGAAAIFILAVIAVLLVIFNAIAPKNPLVYISDNQILIHNNNNSITATSSFLKESSEWDSLFGGQNISSYLNYFVKLNKAGDKMFYIADIDTVTDSSNPVVNLYYCNTQKSKSGNGTDQGTKIASNVSVNGDSAFTIDSKGDYAIYLKDFSTDTGGKLYINNLKDETLVDRDVLQYWFLESASKICYLKSNGDGTSDLYEINTNMKDDAVKIDTGVSNVISITDNDSKIYYTKKSSDDINSMTIYCKENGKSKVKILSDINSIESKIENGNFYYTKATQTQVNLATLVDDDLAASDAAMTEPVYPNESDYETQVPYTDYYGYTYYETQFDSTAYYNAIDAYNTAEDAYYAKEQRDSLREDLQNETYTETEKDLYIMNNGKSTKITSDYNESVYTSSNQNTIVYSKIDMGTFDKIKIEDVTDASSVETAFEDTIGTSNATSISINGGSEINAFDDKTVITNPVVSNDGKTLYCIDKTDSKDDTGEFLSYDISSGKLIDKKVIDSDVNDFVLFKDSSNIYYYKNVEDNSGDLYVLSNGKHQKIASDVGVGTCTLYYKDNVVLYQTDCNSKDGTGTLNMFKDNKETKIADDVSYYFYEGKSGVYYLTNYDSAKGKGDLKQYVNANKSNLISEDVNAVLPTINGDRF